MSQDASEALPPDLDQGALLRMFVAESRECLRTMEAAALELERQPRAQEPLAELFRAVHTLKGNAFSLGFGELARLAHALEDRLHRVREGKDRVGAALVNGVLSSVDALRELVDAAAAPIEAGAAADGGRTLRVEVGKLDRLLDLTGELSVVRARIGRLAAALDHHGALLREACEDLDALCQDLQDEILKARAVPIAPALQLHERTLRDAAAVHGKQVRLLVEAAAVELDTTAVEALRDPLTHLVRNAVAHGLESAEERVACGKPPEGTLTLRARQAGSSVIVDVVDDGRGFGRARIAARAVARGLLPAGASDAELLNVVFAPGFTTADEVSELSGRGVGLDAVRHAVEALRGAVTIASEEGKGATISLELPASVAIIDALFVAAGGAVVAIPLDAVVECGELPASDRGRPGGVLQLAGGALPWLRLARHFGGAWEPAGRDNLVIVQHGRRRLGLAVGRLMSQGQTVVKPLPPLVKAAQGVSGTAVLGTGEVALVLDVAALLQAAAALPPERTDR